MIVAVGGIARLFATIEARPVFDLVNTQRPSLNSIVTRAKPDHAAARVFVGHRDEVWLGYADPPRERSAS